MKKYIIISLALISLFGCDPVKQIQRSQKRIDAVKKLFPCDCPEKIQVPHHSYRDGGIDVLDMNDTIPFYHGTINYIGHLFTKHDLDSIANISKNETDSTYNHIQLISN